MARRFSLTGVVHAWIHSQSWPEGLAIDMTVGGGYDLLFLAQSFPPSTIVGIDIQAAALERARERVRSALGESVASAIHWKEGCHSRVLEWIDQLTQESFLSDSPLSESTSQVALAIYNLGYLPGSDKSLITQAETTVESLRRLEPRVAAGGAISLMLYTGHEGGHQEAEGVTLWAKSLDPARWHLWQMQRLGSLGKSPPPSWILLQRV